MTVQPKRCATPGCEEKEHLAPWGVDGAWCCAACRAELEMHLKSVRELAAIWEGKKE